MQYYFGGLVVEGGGQEVGQRKGVGGVWEKEQGRAGTGGTKAPPPHGGMVKWGQKSKLTKTIPKKSYNKFPEP